MKHEAVAIAERVSRETSQRLRQYEALLRKWNATINLVSRERQAEFWTRHFEDSLQLVPLLPSDALTGVDLGSGAGFPGLVLSIATGLHFTLIEADHRKAAFLREVAAATRAPVTILAERMERVQMPQVDVLTARALAPLPDLLELGARFLKPDGVALLLKGAQADAEIADAGRIWSMTVDRYPSTTHATGMVIKLSGLLRAVH